MRKSGNRSKLVSVLWQGLGGDRLAGIAARQLRTDRHRGSTLSLDQLRQKFFHVSAGPRLKPRSWPNGARVAVALSFDVDNATISMARGAFEAVELSRGEYGAIDGVPRILQLLDKHAIAATFFIPAVAAALHPSMVSDILAHQRHEIGVHGWLHEAPNTLSGEGDERRLLTQVIEYITEVTGKIPAGYRAPAWTFSRHTLKLIKEAGFLYDSSLMASDDPYEILLDKQPTGMIEIPVDWIRDDYPYFGPAASGSLPSAELVLAAFQAEFDLAYEEGGLFVLTMHPHIIGHRSRILILSRLIGHIKSKPDVWFATHEQVANYVKGTCSDLS